MSDAELVEDVRIKPRDVSNEQVCFDDLLDDLARDEPRLRIVIDPIDLSQVDALVWRDGEVLGEGGNSVHADNDPTAHAEKAAVRAAARTLRAHGHCAVVVASGEPCV